MKKELKSGILSADKSADDRPINRPTVFWVNVIAVLQDHWSSGLYTCRDNYMAVFISYPVPSQVPHILSSADMVVSGLYWSRGSILGMT